MSSAALSLVEAARLRAVLEDAVEKLSFLAVVTPDVVGHRDEMAALVGEEISATIREQRALEARFHSLVLAAAAAKAGANKVRLREAQAALAAIAPELRESIRALCRTLKDNPDMADNLGKLAEERDAIADLLGAAFVEAGEGGHVRALAEHVRAEAAARERVTAVAAKEEATAAEVARLTAALRGEAERHVVAMEATRAELAALKEGLRKLKGETTTTVRYARKEVTARTEAGGHAAAGEEKELAGAIARARARLAEEAAAHDASIELLRAETEELTRTADAWKARLAADAAARGAELKAVTAERDAQRAVLDALQARYERDLAAMVERTAEAERVAAEKAVALERAAGEARAARDLVRVLGRKFEVVWAARKAAEEAKAKAKGGGKKGK